MTQAVLFDVYAQGLNAAPFQAGLSHDEAIALAGRLAATEGAAWVRQADKLVADRVYASGAVEPWILDEDGLPLCNA